MTTNKALVLLMIHINASDNVNFNGIRQEVGLAF